MKPPTQQQLDAARDTGFANTLRERGRNDQEISTFNNLAQGARAKREKAVDSFVTAATGKSTK